MVAAGVTVVPDVQVMHTACVPMMPLLHAFRRGVSGAIIKNASLACVVCADRFTAQQPCTTTEMAQQLFEYDGKAIILAFDACDT